MSNVLDQARKYIGAIPAAVAGQSGHDQTFRVACVLVNGFGLNVDDARLLMSEYSQRCQPPWSAREIDHKLTDAERTPDQKGRGYLVTKGKSVKHTFRDRGHSPTLAPTPISPQLKPAQRHYEGSSEIPKPMEDGTRALLTAAFDAGEGIRLCHARTGEDGREMPKDAGVVLSREEWLRKLDANKGDPNGFYQNAERNGIFVSINPMRLGGSKDSDVTAHRHTLVEWDDISKEEQWSIITQSKIPCTAVIDSGGKSLHAWVRVDAKDRDEFRERVQFLYQHFESSGRKLDDKNKNPSRFSRLANCIRGKKRQELVAVKIGAESWTAWATELESENIGHVTSIKELRKFDCENDPNTLLGSRWLCRKGACLFIGPSGVGKSSLACQAAITWSLGKEFFGIKPARPLKSLFIQAENDEGDLAEMTQGVLTGLAIAPDSADEQIVDDSVKFVRDSSHTGKAFCDTLQRLIDLHRPDLVWLDPLLSFIGDDISKQAVCSQFLRTWLGPIADATGVCWMIMHHTNKPSKDPKARAGWTSTDYSYEGTGSAELTNWARAACVLQRIDEVSFRLMLAKRGKRAGAKDIDFQPTSTLYLKHADTGIRWEQIPQPAEPEKKSRFRAGKGDKAERADEHKVPGHPEVLDALRPHIDGFLNAWGLDEVLTLGAASKKLMGFAKIHNVEFCKRTADKILFQMGNEAMLTVKKTGEKEYEISL